MSKALRLALLLGSLAFARWACAAAYGLYPGLSDMIGNSQAIVVVSIQSGPLSSWRYAIVNAEGSAFWIPRQTDLSVVKPADVRGSIEALLNVILNYLSSRERALDEGVQRFLSDSPR